MSWMSTKGTEVYFEGGSGARGRGRGRGRGRTMHVDMDLGHAGKLQ